MLGKSKSKLSRYRLKIRALTMNFFVARIKFLWLFKSFLLRELQLQNVCKIIENWSIAEKLLVVLRTYKKSALVNNSKWKPINLQFHGESKIHSRWNILRLFFFFFTCNFFARLLITFYKIYLYRRILSAHNGYAPYFFRGICETLPTLWSYLQVGKWPERCRKINKLQH